LAFCDEAVWFRDDACLDERCGNDDACALKKKGYGECAPSFGVYESGLREEEAAE